MSTPEPFLAQGEEPAVPGAQVRVLAVPGVLFTLVRREIWEHRVLWMAPLAVSLLLILSAVLTNPGNVSLDFSMNGESGLAAMLGGANARMSLALFGLFHWGLSLPLYLLLTLIVTFYLTDCLYAERRDRSILFWKSLPVSDLTTVISKALVGMVLVPCGVYLLAVLTDGVLSAIWYLRSQLLGSGPPLLPWSTVGWLKVQALLAVGMVFSVLWLAPLGAYLLVVSAWARRNALLWASLPPLLAPLIERQTLGTTYLWDLLTYRTLGMWHLPELAAAKASATIQMPHMLSPLSPVELFDALPVGRLFTNINLWLGLIVALALGYLAARIRRYRDDS
jgi:ABC-2 type transport system permease protein